MSKLNSIIKATFVAIVCGLVFANCSGKGSTQETAEETFSFEEGLNACEKAEKLMSLSAPAKPLKEGTYKAEDICISVPEIGLQVTGKADDPDNIIYEGLEGKSKSGLRKIYKTLFQDYENTFFKFENGNLYVIEKGKLQDNRQTYKQEGNTITVYSEKGDMLVTFYYKKGIFFLSKSEDGMNVAIIYKKIEEVQE
jgi:hypothetical protein